MKHSSLLKVGAFLFATLSCFGQPLEYCYTRSEAFARAKAEGKMVLADFGRIGCSSCAGMAEVFDLTTPSIRQWLQASCIMWKSDIDASSDYQLYDTDLPNFELPLVCFIDPNGVTGSYLSRSTGLVNSNTFHSNVIGLCRTNLPIVVTNLTGNTLSNSSFVVKGIARVNAALAGSISNVPIASVQYRLNATGTFASASGTTNWSAQVSLTPGVNRFESYVSYEGGKASWTNTVTLVFTDPTADPTSAKESNPIQLRPGTNLCAGGVALDVGTYAIPCVTDWNGDGTKDLVVGFQTNGMIRVYTNSGTDGNPAFTGYSILQAGDTDIVYKSPGCGSPAPWICDFDGDGKRDVLVGAGGDGTVWFYRNTNTDASPKLVSMGQLKTGGSALNVGSRSVPCIQDWNEDGLPDLLCGNGNGNIYFFKNTNTLHNPIFAQGVMLDVGGVALNIGIRSVPRVVDWDGDGLKDLVCSSDTGVYWCRNTNSNANPTLQAPLPLQVPNTSGVLTNIITGPRMRVLPVDWNNDAVMDVLVGNADGTITYFEGYHLTIRNVRMVSANRIAIQWDSAPYLKYNVLVNGCPSGIICPTITNLPSGGTSTYWTNPITAGQQFYRIQMVQ